jgi:hypothetical protein
MLIKGIRSFSPDNTNVIEFYQPLTLIVGHNGAGKTVRRRICRSYRATSRSSRIYLYLSLIQSLIPSLFT